MYSINDIFKDCSSLKYMNLYSFQLNQTVINTIYFENIESNVKICIKDTDTQKYVLAKNDKIIFICSDTCYNESNTKSDIYNNLCVDSCTKNGSIYEYNNICYQKCPNNTYELYNDKYDFENNSIYCLNESEKPENYYLDSNDGLFKKCFEICESCNGNGNETYHNCNICKSNYTFLNDSIYATNCYPECQYFYYFNQSNFYQCTSDIICPEKYIKSNNNNKQCIYKNENETDFINITEYLEHYTDSTQRTINETNNSYIENITIYIDNNMNPIQTTINETEYLYVENRTVNIVNNLNTIQTIIYESKYIHELEILNIDDPDEFLRYIQEILSKEFNTNDIDNGKDLVKTNRKITATITSTKNQNNNKKKNVTTIDLGRCEAK